MSKKRKDYDWIRIEEDYCAGILRVSEISRKYGAPATTICSRAKRNNWVRISAAIRAKRVKEEVTNSKTKAVNQQMSVATDGKTVSIDSSNVASIINQAIDQDVTDMNLGLENARKALSKASELMEDIVIPTEDPAEADQVLRIAGRELKSLVEVTKISIETIRKIRGLDEKDEKDDDLSRKSIDELKAEIERLERS